MIYIRNSLIKCQRTIAQDASHRLGNKVGLIESCRIRNLSTKISAHGQRGRLYPKRDLKDAMTTLNYGLGTFIIMFGVAYASSPLYKVFCGMTGFGGTTQINKDINLSQMKPCKQKKIKVYFNADTNMNMKWKFKPQQTFVYAYPGEAALAFYAAENPTDRAIVGISTYNVVPFDAGPYFNKIQCFCFEEQRLNPHESIDMPVFFYIDPAYLDDPLLQDVKEITLSYTFFEAKNFDYEKYREEGLLP